MELSTIDLLTAAAAVTGVWMCGVTRLTGLLWGLAVQTTLLGYVALVKGIELRTPTYFILAGVVIAVKAIPIPLFLHWTAERVGIQRDRGTLLSPTLALLAGCAALAVGYFLTGQVAGPAAE